MAAKPSKAPRAKSPNLKASWQPGQSGNPAGRQKGSRNKLGEQFLADLHADWTDHGPDTIRQVREDKPDVYLKVVASILPAQLNVKVSEMDELTDEQLTRQLAHVVASLAKAGVDFGEGIAASLGPSPTGKIPTLQ